MSTLKLNLGAVGPKSSSMLWFDPQEVERFQASEVLRCLLHTILFHRVLGATEPEHVVSELFDVGYAKANAAAADKLVEDAVQLFGSVQHTRVSPSAFRGEIALRFYEKRVKRILGFTSSAEKLVWEEWRVPLIVDTTPRTGGDAQSAGAYNGEGRS